MRMIKKMWRALCRWWRSGGHAVNVELMPRPWTYEEARARERSPEHAKWLRGWTGPGLPPGVSAADIERASVLYDKSRLSDGGR